MKTVGLLGGMSWESTASYYRLINEAVRDRLGGLHSARLLLYSMDFEQIARLQRAGDWAAAGAMLARSARALESAGAECVIVCTNTMHVVADEIESAIAIPLLHIADATAAAVKDAGHSTVGLLGTRFTMEQDFYRDRLERDHGLKVITPAEDDREAVHRIIFEELCVGRIMPESRERYRQVIARLAQQGAEAVVLGCTEISMLVSPTDVDVPLFDTMQLHALRTAAWALGEHGAARHPRECGAVGVCT
jgi:aspartate racemase